MKSRHFLLTLLFMLSLSGCSNDSEFDETLEKAQRGDANAQYNLGWMYANGEGVPEDDTEAVKWYRLAAEKGHASAQANLDLIRFSKVFPQQLSSEDNETWKSLRCGAEIEDRVNPDICADLFSKGVKDNLEMLSIPSKFNYCDRYLDADIDELTALFQQKNGAFRLEIGSLDKCISKHPGLKHNINYVAVDILLGIDSGKISAEDDGIEKINNTIAIFELLARHSHYPAQHNLAGLYNPDPTTNVFKLIGLNYEKFVYWTKIAASNGEPRSMFNLAERMARPPEDSADGIASDYETAFMLFTLIKHEKYVNPQYVSNKIINLGKKFSVERKGQLVEAAKTFDLKDLAPL